MPDRCGERVTETVHEARDRTPARDRIPDRPGTRLPVAAVCLLGTTLLAACGDGGPTRPGGRAGGAAAALPDLTADAIVFSRPLPFDDETLAITGRLSNSGGGDAGAFSWSLAVDGTEIARGRVSGLAAGQELRGSAIGVDPAGPFPAGDHEVTLTVDPDGEVRESDETSNVTARRLPVQSPGYDIRLTFLSALTEADRTIAVEAAESWEAIVTGDLEPNLAELPPACGNPKVTESVDDVRIFVRVDSIDGAGGILARGGPCISRGRDSPTPSLPVTGQFTIDESDFGDLKADGRIHALLLHEIGHVMGIGTRWDDFGLLAGAGTDDPFFVGERAATAFDRAGGRSVYPGDGTVPVANTGGRATRDSHWRESILLTELMTGFAEPPGVIQQLSAITAGSLADLGYRVDFASPEIDDYRVADSGALVAPEPGQEKSPWDEVQTSPQYVVTGEGRIERVR